MIRTPTYHIAKHLVGLLKPYIGKTETYIKNSAELVEILDMLKLHLVALLVSLDVISSPQSSWWKLPRVIGAPVVKMFEYVLKSTYCIYDGAYYEHLEGTVWGLP